ncbi:E3 SUMO-protein ligase KIAA1586-like [Photinus pyralis]|uniref:E3 SUMO-protein ligase KIAA1586-like n=1 Tax=Photinus pyralis TaxID=7054 RepID=UPI00126722BD|nr:E3 SUMO-protein ligase KIAA1586-like [Photinus pyralis]
MIGKKSGVATQLISQYPDLVVWHCSNHRLELAVHDVLEEVDGINHFKIFFDKLYSLYSASPKNQYELKRCAANLDVQLYSIGRILDTRWVSSSLRSVKAVWSNYNALYQHFDNASIDMSRQSKERCTYSGLKDRLTETGFVYNLGLLYDALSELSYLSLELQKRNKTLPEAHALITRQIRVVESMIDNPGIYLKQVETSINVLEFRHVKLHNGRRVTKINSAQFYRSLTNNLKQRLLRFSSHRSGTEPQISEDYNKFVKTLEIFDRNQWPQEPSIRYGEDEIRVLCEKFKLSGHDYVRSFREYVDSGIVSKPLDLLMKTVNTLVVSTAECERIFSAMNIIHSDLRNKLKVTTVSSLLFIKCVGPPLPLFKPQTYVKAWMLLGRRDADYTKCAARQKDQAPNLTTEYQLLWDHLN